MEKILIIKHGSLGDVISSTAVIKPIRDYYKKSLITILTTKKYADFYDKSNFSNSIIKDNRKGIMNFIIIIYKIISMKFDLVIDLQNSKRTFIYCLIIRLLSRSNINGTHLAANQRFKYNKKNPPHVIEGLSKQIEMLGISSLKSPFLKWLEKENFSITELENKKYFLINPGCSSKNLVKRWPSKNFSEVCTFLISINIVPVVIGEGDDIQPIKEIEKNENRIINLYNKSPLDVIYNLSLKAEGALSNDTGPAHLIAATNCNIHLVLSSFSNTKTVTPQSNNVSFTLLDSINDITSSQIINKLKLILKYEN